MRKTAGTVCAYVKMYSDSIIKSFNIFKDKAISMSLVKLFGSGI
jgi:hypothetical protein